MRPPLDTSARKPPTANFATPGGLLFVARRHGRGAPPMTGIAWERVWDQPTEAIRAVLGIETYASPYPADLFECFTAA